MSAEIAAVIVSIILDVGAVVTYVLAGRIIRDADRMADAAHDLYVEANALFDAAARIDKDASC